MTDLIDEKAYYAAISKGGDPNKLPEPEIEKGHMRPICEVAVDAYAEMVNPYPSFKFPLWQNFTKATGGIRTKEFSILCGATGTGKTEFLANLSVQLLTNRIKHYVASVETGDTDYFRRILSIIAEEDLNKGEAVKFEKITHLRANCAHFVETEDLYLSIFDNRISLNLLLQELAFAHDNFGCKVALLDNLNFFLEVTSAQNSIIEMDRVIHELIMFCKRTDMHVVMVMHPKKTENGRVESEFDIKGSSTAVQEAHNVFLWNRPTKTDQDAGYTSDRYRELTIAKMRRNGEFVRKRIMFQYSNRSYIEREMI